MRALDHLEPLPVLPPDARLGRAFDVLRGGTPIAFDGEGQWRLIRPIDAIAIPLSRQLCDVPNVELPTIPVGMDIDLRALLAHDVWGATRRSQLVGRVDSGRLVGSLIALVDQDPEPLLAQSARDRMIPKLLHDLANALLVADAGLNRDRESRPAARTALRNAIALLAHIRGMYTETRAAFDDRLEVTPLLQELEPMLRLAASPATIEVVALGLPAVMGQRWRLVSALLNLVLNAGAVASAIVVRARVRGAEVIIDVEDDGPGIPLRPPVSPEPGLHGHGLPSIRRQVMLMRGHFRISRRPGGGSIVTLRLPAAE